MRKFKVLVFYNENQKASAVIINFLKQNMAHLKEFCQLQFHHVTPANQNVWLSKGVKKIPSIFCEDKFVAEEKPILRYLLDLKKRYVQASRIPDEFNLEEEALKQIAYAQKIPTKVDGRTVYKYKWDDTTDDKVGEEKAFAQRLDAFKAGKTDYNQTWQEKRERAIGSKTGTIKSGDNEDDPIAADNAFMSAASYNIELADTDGEDSFRAFANEELKKPINMF